MTAHDDLDALRKLANADQAAQITQLENKFGADATLKVTGTATDNAAAKISGGHAGAWHVQALLQGIQAQENGHPDAKRDAMEQALQTAVKADPTFIDRLETQLAANPNLAGKITARFMDNPDGVKDKVNDLVKSNNIAALMDSIPAHPVTTPAAGTNTPTPTTKPVTAKPFNEADELKGIQPQAVQDAVKATFDKIASNATIKPEFDKLQDQQKRDLIKHLAEGAAGDPKFLDTVNDLVDTAPQLIAQGMDRFADHTKDAVKEDVEKKQHPDTTPDSDNPFSGILKNLLGGGMMGRIGGVLSGLLNMIVGFFERLIGGAPTGGTSNNGFGLTTQAGGTAPGMLPATLPGTTSTTRPQAPTR